MIGERERVYLKEMGVSYWQLVHPERLSGYVSPKIAMDAQLLLVSPEFPNEQNIPWFIKVLASFQMELSQVKHCYPHQVSQFDLTKLTWVWLADCNELEIDYPSQVRLLRTASLNQVKESQRDKRDLWQQICAYGVNQ